MLQDWIGHERASKCKTHTSVPYPMWTCRWWGHWGWVQSHPRRDSGSCRVCWCSAENMGRWLCTRLYPHTSSHPAWAGNRDDTCTEGAKSTGDMSKSHSLRVLALLTFGLDQLQEPFTACHKTSVSQPDTCVFPPTKGLIFAQFICKALLISQPWHEIQLLLSNKLHK